MTTPNNQIAVFEQQKIRSLEHEGETYYSIVDVIAVLTDSPSPKHYWAMLKKRENELVTICYQLKLQAADGKFYKTDCANTEGVLRVIQSVPSPKAEPFKLWMADLGKKAIAEANDPELTLAHLREHYAALGRTEKWIANRLQSIKTRKQLTDEWQNRGIKESKEYGILTATIAKGTFGMTPNEHGQHKNLTGKAELRDHMTDLELILTAFGEEVTRQLTINDDAQGFAENHEVAQRGGSIAGDARRNYEQKTGLKVLSSNNFLEKNAQKTLEEGQNE